MNDKIFSSIVLVCIVGSAAISSLDSHYTFKSIFYNIAMVVLAILLFERFYKYRKKDKKVK